MISVENVRKSFGPLVAVDDLTFRVDRGEVVGFLGPNGAGKSTTMRMLTGTLEPDEGRILFDGVPIEDDLRGAKRRVGYLPESNPLYDEMLVSEYLEYVAELRGLPASDARSGIADAVDETGLAAVFYRPIGELSKGYRQRVGMAGAILHRPDVLILDEPTEGLDPNQRVDIRNLVHELGRERTVLLSTHVMHEVEATCDRVVILRGGRLAADGRVEDLLAGRGTGARYRVEVATARGETPEVEDVLRRLAGVDACRAELVDGRVRARVDARAGEELRPRIFEAATRNGWTLWELHREQATLEDVFRTLTAESGDAEEGREEVARAENRDSGLAAGEVAR